MDSATLEAIDRHVGRQVQLARKTNGWTQTELGRAIGVTYQQIQKLEKGENRFSASRLFVAATRLGMGVDPLFPQDDHSLMTMVSGAPRTPLEALALDRFRDLEPEQQKVLLQLMDSLASTAPRT